MAWTSWRLLAYRGECFTDGLDYDGPSCYELGTGGIRGGRIAPHYVGETVNEMQRMSCYGRDGSHLCEIIAWHLRQGWCLYFRGTALSTKAAAVAMQNHLLERYCYDWNDLLNRTR